MGIAVGIDLGTTNTVVAAVVDGVATTLADEHGRRLLPSVVSFHPSGNILVGDLARERRIVDPENTVYSVKRLLGRSYGTPEVQQARPRFPFPLVQGPRDAVLVEARGQRYTLPEVSAFVLRRAKAIAEFALGEPVDKAVITVPANFNELQRASTKVAGRLAGLDVLRILNEPTAAALAYGQQVQGSERVAVFDLGGGTFDMTVLDLSGRVFEVVCTAGDTQLGGDDIDHLVAEQIAHEYVARFRWDPRTDPISFGRLRLLGEEIKKLLSAREEISEDLHDLGFGEDGVPLSLRFKMTRNTLETLAKPLLDRAMALTRNALQGHRLEPSHMSQVLLVGGATRMPMVARAVAESFGRPPTLKVNPDEVVALGAAIQAHALAGVRAPNSRGQSGAQPAAAPAPAPVPTAAAAPRIPPARPVVQPTAPRPQIQKKPGGLSKDEPATAKPHLVDEPAIAAAREAFLQGKPPAPSPFAAEEAAGNPGESTFTTNRTMVSKGATKPAKPQPPAPPPPAPVESSTPVVGVEAVDPKKVDGFQSVARALPTDPFADRPDAAFANAPVRPGLPPSPKAGMAIPEPEVWRPRPETPEPWPAEPSQSVNKLLGISELEQVPVEAARVGLRRERALLVDVTPLSLRVETTGGFSDVLIRANTQVPCDRTRGFSTTRDGQDSVVVRVAQGEERSFVENMYLGEVHLTDIPALARGEANVQVTFALDADGTLEVKAVEQKSGREASARLRLVGMSNDVDELSSMAARQASRRVIG